MKLRKIFRSEKRRCKICPGCETHSISQPLESLRICEKIATLTYFAAVSQLQINLGFLQL